MHIVVGAGFAGLIAAQTLRRAGLPIRVIDKASRPGGRLSTRRLGGASFDTGVRSFEVRDPEVLAVLTALADSSLRVEQAADCWRVSWVATAADLAQALAAGLTVESALVTHVDTGGVGLWGSGSESAQTVLLTMPAPQADLLLARSGLPTLEAAAYEPRLILLAVLDGGPDPQPVDGVFDDIEISEDAAGRRLLRAQVTAHESARRWEADATHTLAQLVAEVEAPILAAECKRWRYATATSTHPETYLELDGLPVLIGGDGFGADQRAASSVERACRSGLDMAAAVMSR